MEGATRIRLDFEDRKLLAEIIDEAAANEVIMPRKFRMVQLLRRISMPLVGHPKVPSPSSVMSDMSEAYYYPDAVPQTIKDKRKIGKCERCGLVDPVVIEIHHIDADRRNNDPSNLAALCANCHRHKTQEQRKLWARIQGERVDFTVLASPSSATSS